MTIELPLGGALSRGHVALIDDQDWPLVGPWSWNLDVHPNTNYARGYRSNRSCRLHQLILGTRQLIDHIDGNGLNNQRSNLRLVTRQQNNANQRKTRGSSRFKGVSLHRAPNDAGAPGWMARIKIEGRNVYLGRYFDEAAAAMAYDAAARRAFGSFAALNFPAPGERSALIDDTSEFAAVTA